MTLASPLMGDDHAGQGPTDVVLPSVPVRAFLQSQDHQHDLVRELKLIDIGERFAIASTRVPAELGVLIEAILGRYADVRSVTRDQAVAALAENEDTVDLVVPIVPGMAADLQEWLTLLEEADQLCDRGLLLTVGPPADVRRLRRWYVEALLAEIDQG